MRWDDPEARGSDDWPMTRAEDGYLYAGFGDGRGFEPSVPEKPSLGFARIAGPPPAFEGVNVRSAVEQRGDGMRGRKGVVARRGSSG